VVRAVIDALTRDVSSLGLDTAWLPADDLANMPT
jgi:hypothetical protein